MQEMEAASIKESPLSVTPKKKGIFHHKMAYKIRNSLMEKA